MCGFFGVVGITRPLDASAGGFSKDLDVLRHRGPDDSGCYRDDYSFLTHRRLSIIDLASGHQPILNEDATKCIVFNGEIYNFAELGRDLKDRGHRFKTNSDTEVILHAYEEYGASCLDKLRGMFAFVIWDNERREVFIARDRLGIKPLFYSYKNGLLYFGSEMKALLQAPQISREIGCEAIGSYFTIGYIPAPLTIFQDIEKLLPGHYLFSKGEAIEVKKYWDVEFRPDPTKSRSYYIDGMLERIDESIKLRMIAEVPLGAFLSGGIDSGGVVAHMSRHSTEPVRTFCIGFGGEAGGYLDERQYARSVAERFGADHHEYEVLPDCRQVIRKIVASFDEPFADSSVLPSFYVCQLCSKHVKVALSGLGGDELFCGYERYLGLKLSTMYSRIPAFFHENLFKRYVEKLPERRDGHYTINHLKRFMRSADLPVDQRYIDYSILVHGFIRENLFNDREGFMKGFDYCRNLLLGYFNAPNASDPIDRALYCDFKTYLPEDILACTDRMSMHHSLEVRVPFLDHKLVEFSAGIPSTYKIRLMEKKAILKKAFRGLLPERVMNHRKQGFDGPMTRWIQTDLKDFILETLSKENLRRHGILNEEVVDRILDNHFRRVEIHDRLIWALVMFQLWYDMYIEKGGGPVPSPRG